MKIALDVLMGCANVKKATREIIAMCTHVMQTRIRIRAIVWGEGIALVVHVCVFPGLRGNISMKLVEVGTDHAYVCDDDQCRDSSGNCTPCTCTRSGAGRGVNAPARRTITLDVEDQPSQICDSYLRGSDYYLDFQCDQTLYQNTYRNMLKENAHYCCLDKEPKECIV